MPDYTVTVDLVRPPIVARRRAQAWTVQVVDPHTYTVETGLVGEVPAPIAPVNTVAPVVSGTPTEGETLSCTEGTWTGTEPITYEYQWTLDLISTSDPIPGATSPTYVLTAGDVGLEIFCVVTATNSAGSASANSNTVGPVASADTPPVNTVAPVASGTVRIGELLSCTTGTWTGTPAPTYAYQWTRDGSPIGGATSATYTVVAADISAQIACEVTATNTAGSAMEPSNDLSSPWRDILVARPGALIWDYQDPQCYDGAGVGSGVATLKTVNGTTLFTQGTSGSRPTRLTTGLSFDGTADHMIGNSFANVLEQAHTMCWGFDSPEDSTTAVRALICASSNTSGASSQQVSVNYSRPGSPNATRQRYAIGDSTFITISLAGYSIGAGPYNLALRAGTPGNGFSAVILDGSLTAISSSTRGTNDAVDFDWLYLGVRAIGVTPTLAQYWQGVIRHFALDDEQWSDTDTALYRTCAIAAGVM